MGSVFQSAVLPSLLAAPTLATRCVHIWTTTDAARAVIATGNVKAQNFEAVPQHCLVQLYTFKSVLCSCT